MSVIALKPGISARPKESAEWIVAAMTKEPFIGKVIIKNIRKLAMRIR
jgi:hypothetical protein